MSQNERGRRRFQFRLRDLLLVVLIVGLGLALYVERSHRVVLEKKLESLGTTPRIWVWSPDPYEVFTTEAHVGVVGNVFVPRNFRVTSETVIELACWRAEEGKLVRFAGPVTTALGSEGPILYVPARQLRIPAGLSHDFLGISQVHVVASLRDARTGVGETGT